MMLQGLVPVARSKAYAMAKRPQSTPPFCVCGISACSMCGVMLGSGEYRDVS